MIKLRSKCVLQYSTIRMGRPVNARSQKYVTEIMLLGWLSLSFIRNVAIFYCMLCTRCS